MIFRGLAIGYAIAMVVTVAVVVAARALDRPERFFTNEPSAALDGPWYAGFQSNITVLIWATGAVCALFAWATTDRRRGSVLLWGGMLTALLGLDDLLLLHEELYPKAGVSESMAFGIYLLAFAAWAAVFRDDIGPFGERAVINALAWFGLSGYIDVFIRTLPLIEDTAKLLGVVSWSVLMVALAAERTRAAVDPDPPSHRAVPDRAAAEA